ncbi:hypothetical protein PMAA_076560 [Talaromyces marneffei ATCC 18224]|uniref:AMP-dependent synthetase/ligase domain-containing protein n=1 Tax=Talaromyces marneffei (strain ATCC 18224 / CBS 334.59 / QM 7333) TaxID=441960 RepID=B6QCE0_TALMQ|nr:hypothetical protein PMAA_076560 [Talaromyces marneffei ATCC 18224]
MMVFKAETHINIPTKDILSYIFDKPAYDQNKPILYCLLVLAIIGASGVYTGTNPAYPTAELSHHIKTSKSKFLISEPEILESLQGAATENNILCENIWIFDPLGQHIPAGHKSWRELLNFGEQDWVRFNDAQTAKTKPAARLLSSGTSGLPKGLRSLRAALLNLSAIVSIIDWRSWK